MSTEENRLGVQKTYKLYIDGKFPRTESGRSLPFKLKRTQETVHLCLASRKDARDAITAALAAQSGWAKTQALLRGQIIYRIAEMLEGRRSQFELELVDMGMTIDQAKADLGSAIDLLVHYAGWTDKAIQLLSAVNPVSGPHFNHSTPESTGVSAVIAPQALAISGLVQAMLPSLVAGNAQVLIAGTQYPLVAMSFAEVIHTSDVPKGVINILTGDPAELVQTLESHAEVQTITAWDATPEQRAAIKKSSLTNLKRVRLYTSAQAPGALTLIQDQLELKTIWHPVGY